MKFVKKNLKRHTKNNFLFGKKEKEAEMFLTKPTKKKSLVGIVINKEIVLLLHNP